MKPLQMLSDTSLVVFEDLSKTITEALDEDDIDHGIDSAVYVAHHHGKHDPHDWNTHKTLRCVRVQEIDGLDRDPTESEHCQNGNQHVDTALFLLLSTFLMSFSCFPREVPFPYSVDDDEIHDGHQNQGEQVH